MEIEIKLDQILRHLVDTNEAIIFYNSIYAKPNKILLEITAVTYQELGELIKILENDSYVECIWTHANQIVECKIKLTGRYFIRQGGYVGKLKRQDYLEQEMRMVAKRNLLLTTILAIGTSIAAWYYLHELWVYYFVPHPLR
jgi:hypothetical protein